MMPDRFDWQTEEEEWVGASAERQTVKRRKPRRWLIVPLILLGLILTGALIFWQVRQRIQDAEDERMADILSSYQLIREAHIQEDEELFRTMLSGRDLEWAMSQQALFSRGLINDLQPFGLLPMSEEIESIDVELGSSFQSAEVAIEHRYSVTAGDGLTETIRLKVNNVFRLGDRWLWSPPRADYWGGNIDESLTGRYMTLFFPQRDEDIARRLHQDLDDLIAGWCARQNQYKCPEDLYLQLRLSRDPSSLLDLAEQFYRSAYSGDHLLFNGRAYELTIPTPSLVGIPTDETSYQALLRGYGANVIGALAARTMGRDCCGNKAIYRSAIRNQLNELEILPGPTFSSAEPTTASALPDRNIRLFCAENFGHSSSVYHFNFASNTWNEEPLNRPFREVKGMPDGEGMLLLEMGDEEEKVRIRIILRRNGAELLLLDDLLSADEARSMNWFLQDRDKRLLVEIPDLIQGVSTYYSFDLPACSQNNCSPEVHHLLSIPTWSPDGRQLLVRQYGMIWRQQGLQVTPLTDGTAPFWIDDETFGFVRQLGDEQVVILRRGPSEEPVPAVSTRKLLDVLPVETKPAKLAIGHISTVPGNASEWIILAFGLSSEDKLGEAFLFNVNPNSDEIILAFRSENLHSFNLSTNGRWLAATSYDTLRLIWTMNIFDLSTKTTEGIVLDGQNFSELPPEYNWSPDGNWILLMNQGFASLIEPEQRSYISIFPPEPGCTQAIWTN